MDIYQALFELGVRDETLSAQQKQRLDEDGFLHLPGILGAAELEAIRARQAAILSAEGTEAGREVHQEQGTDRLSDLVNKGRVFHVVLQRPGVLAAVAHVLGGDMKLSSLNSRSALPGQGLQPLHADWSEPVPPGGYQVCNSIWLLDDFTPENGATRAVPGSHRSGRMPKDEMPDPRQAHPREVQLLGRAGDVVVFNSHTWHGGTLNRTSAPRRAMHAYFCRRGLSQQLDQQKYLRSEAWEALLPAERVLLGVDRPPGTARPEPRSAMVDHL
jgi:ectoine hydroxylase-related dioxygenase (phytanoyl-CoA dioxygenase family)